MKHFLLYFFALLQINLFSQTVGGITPVTDDVIKLDPRASQFDFVPGQVLIKLKDDVRVSLAKVNDVTVMGVASIDAVLQKHNMQKAEKLFPNEKRSFSKRMLKTSNGKEFEQPNLHNIYKVVGDSSLNIIEVINELKADPNVEYAEPNYILSIVESKPVSPALTESEMIEWLKDHPEINVANSPTSPMTKNLLTNDQLHKPNVVTPNDPLYPQQWGIPATQVDAVWDSTTGDTTQLIAILDTGVDWLHPDLKNKIWTNPNEIPDNGMDDDGNGYVDDVRGWDWINNDNNPTDDNSHGTHVAGIAAAEVNNGIGIAGVNWKAKILPLKVFQSSGRADAATIAQGIIYAKIIGATVINMSFGSYSRSMTMEGALENAYTTSVLVAAAGNDGIWIGPCSLCKPFFPAALAYVLGVQVIGASFTNYDQDGPIFSEFPDLLNYELSAPGTEILSSIPDGNYRIYSGTSMAAPLVSGAVSLYKIKHSVDPQELMWGSLIKTSTNYIQINSAININPQPVINFISNTIVDTLVGDNNNGFVDAGETLQLWFTLRNTWGQSDSVFVGIKFGEFEDTTVAQIIKDTAFVGSISPYATRSNESNPLLIHINTDIANNRDIVFEGLLWYNGSPDTVKQKIVLKTNNGIYLDGVMDTTMVLTPNYLWIVNSSFRVGTNGELNILPGVQLNLNKNIVNRGKIIGFGKPDSLITIKGPGSIISGVYGSGIMNFKYTSFSGMRTGFDQGNSMTFLNCVFEEISTYEAGWPRCLFLWGKTIMKDNVIRNCAFERLFSWGMDHPVDFTKNNVEDCLVFGEINTSIFNDYVPLGFNNFIKIRNYFYQTFGVTYRPTALFSYANQPVSNNNFISVGEYCYFAQSGGGDVINIPNQYWGTTILEKLKKKNYDFWVDPTYSMINYQPIHTAPSDSAHGIVWKILVNGKDAQDEVVEPIGVGPQRYDVYFNRPMDTAFVPQLTFGVREPYTQQAVVDSSKWSDDRKIWTAYKTIKLYTGDGINRLRVEGAKDDEGFEIPIEDMRFEFLISAAGSSSLDFAATAGLGKVNLEWSNPQDVPDLLGYNMYRLEHINDSTLTQPVMINTSLINDTLFTDFNVIPNKKYYYYYRTVRTDFSESDSSRVVSTTPYTAALGDGNGDLSVNVLDVLGTVSYILGQNPQPFIFDAADVVRDSIINVLDVVGNVNIILKGTLLKNYLAKTSYGNAKVEFTGNEVYLTTDQPVAGIQLQFKGKGLKDKKFIYSGSAAFENMSSSIGDTMQIALMYSLNKNEFASGKYLIGTINGDAKDISLADVVLSDNEGGKIISSLVDNGVSNIPDNYYLDQNYPNPFNLSTTIQYGIPAKTAGKIVIYNILGQQVRTFDLGEREAGRYKIMWDGKNNYGSVISTGVYIFRFESANFTSAKKMILLK
ncbi:MAG: S8 family serine peptidase [Ignavibacteriaceae bacterium]|jgi:subtilisin family serine protease